jgi:uncharacterized protein YycO
MNERDQNEHKATPHDEASNALDGLLIGFKDLLPGDILLFQSCDQKKHQQKISAATGSPYTHAAVYLGDNEIAEATPPKIRKRQLSESDKEGQVIGVLRSQLGFSGERPIALREFVESLIRNGAWYDFRGIRDFNTVKTKFKEELLNILERDYGKVTANDELARRSYFCSALVVACYAAVGLIDGTAKLAYKAEAFSPADLHEDDTFGWVLGYITADEKDIPSDDPLMTKTLWRDLQDARWWQQGS